MTSKKIPVNISQAIELIELIENKLCDYDNIPNVKFCKALKSELKKMYRIDLFDMLDLKKIDVNLRDNDIKIIAPRLAKVIEKLFDKTAEALSVEQARKVVANFSFTCA